MAFLMFAFDFVSLPINTNESTLAEADYGSSYLYQIYPGQAWFLTYTHHLKLNLMQGANNAFTLRFLFIELW